MLTMDRDYIREKCQYSSAELLRSPVARKDWALLLRYAATLLLCKKEIMLTFNEQITSPSSRL